MRLPPSSMAPGRLLRISRRVLARLLAHPKAQALIAKFKPVHVALKAAQQAQIDADDAQIDADATVEAVDITAREALTDFQLDLLAVVRRTYKDPLYITFLPAGFDAAKTRSGDAMRTVLTGILHHLATQPKDSKLQVHAPLLKAVVASYTAPLAALGKANFALDQADTALGLAKAQWMLGYDALAGDLRSLFPGRKAFVDGFFPVVAKSKGKGKVKEGSEEGQG